MTPDCRLYRCSGANDYGLLSKTMAAMTSDCLFKLQRGKHDYYPTQIRSISLTHGSSSRAAATFVMAAIATMYSGGPSVGRAIAYSR